MSEVVQADREAAASMLRKIELPFYADEVAAGEADHSAAAQAFAAHRIATLSGLGELVEALKSIQRAEAAYRLAHDRHGGGNMLTGRAWDAMRRAGDRARTALANFRPLPAPPEQPTNQGGLQDDR